MKIFQKDKKAKFFIFLVSIFILSQFRLIEHPWNFTPVLAFGILAGYYLRSIAYGYGLIIASMILGDLIIGKYLKQLKLFQLVFSGIASSVIFFIISNFGVWLLSGFYSLNFQGLLECYVAGIPFFRSTLISTLIFVFVIKWIFDKLKFYPPLAKERTFA